MTDDVETFSEYFCQCHSKFESEAEDMRKLNKENMNVLDSVQDHFLTGTGGNP